MKKGYQEAKSLKYLYGPVGSWRLGRSLGIDLLSRKGKVCTFDCLYCQLGLAKPAPAVRKLFVPTARVIAELKRLPPVPIDYITFSGRGEPTLARNLGQAIKAVKKLRPEPIAVLTNGSLLYRKEVRRELTRADLVAVKIDASSPGLFNLINRPAPEIKLSRILSGLEQFRKEFSGKLALQIMLMAENRAIMRDIAQLAKKIRPDEIQICAPTRAAAIKLLAPQATWQAKEYFGGLKVITPKDKKPKKVQPLSKKDTIRRRGDLS